MKGLLLVCVLSHVLAAVKGCKLTACIAHSVQAKQGSDLVGRSIQLTLTRMGRVESSKSIEDAASSSAAGSASTDAVLEKTDIVLLGESLLASLPLNMLLYLRPCLVCLVPTQWRWWRLW